MLLLGDNVVLIKQALVERDNNVSLVMVDHIHHIARISRRETHRNGRIFVVEVLIVCRDHFLAHRVGRYDVDMTAAILVTGQAILEIVGERAHLMCVGYKLVSPLGKRDSVVDALKQKAPELVLELLYLKRDSRLRIAELLCRFGEAPKLCHVYKSDEISEFH